MIFQAWCFQKYWSAIARDSSMKWFKVEKRKEMFPYVHKQAKMSLFSPFSVHKISPWPCQTNMELSEDMIDKTYNSFPRVTSRNKGGNLGNRHLSRFFDCLAHPNLSATLATDQKWPFTVKKKDPWFEQFKQIRTNMRFLDPIQSYYSIF